MVGTGVSPDLAGAPTDTTKFYHADSDRAGLRPGTVVGTMTPVKVALGQINPTIGDFEGNRRLVLEATAAAERQGAELAIFPELALVGYPPRDLLERAGFLDAAAASLAGAGVVAGVVAHRRRGRVSRAPAAPARPAEPSPTAPR